MSQRASASRSFASPTVAAPAPDVRRRGARLRGRKERGLDQREITFGAHALDEHGTDHAAPADQSRPGNAAIDSPVALQSGHYSVPDGGANQ